MIDDPAILHQVTPKKAAQERLLVYGGSGTFERIMIGHTDVCALNGSLGCAESKTNVLVPSMFLCKFVALSIVAQVDGPLSLLSCYRSQYQIKS